MNRSGLTRRPVNVSGASSRAATGCTCAAARPVHRSAPRADVVRAAVVTNKICHPEPPKDLPTVVKAYYVYVMTNVSRVVLYTA